MITALLIDKYLSAQCTPEEAQRVEEWLGQSPQNKGIFDQLKRMWEETGYKRPESELRDTDAAWLKIKAKISQPPVKKPKSLYVRYIISGAVAAMLIFVAVISFYNTLGTGHSNAMATWTEATTQKGERKQLTLADGTKVWLNAESTLKYPSTFDGGIREVQLTGEAYFDVTHNPQQPFKVISGEVITKVLGTSFNVMAYSDAGNIEVSLDEGKVALSYSDNGIELTPGHKAIFSKNTHTFEESEINSEHNQWRNNIIDFNNVSLLSVVQTLERWYGKRIVINNKELNDCLITANFENPTLPSVLEIVSTALELEITEKEGVYYISGDKCN